MKLVNITLLKKEAEKEKLEVRIQVYQEVKEEIKKISMNVSEI
jgi:hypothetical protein